MKCELCEMNEEEMTKHHLIPKDKQRGKENQVSMLCQSCQRFIHSQFNNKELLKEYNTIQKLKEHETVIKYINWKRKHPNKRIHPKRTKNKKFRDHP